MTSGIGRRGAMEKSRRRHAMIGLVAIVVCGVALLGEGPGSGSRSNHETVVWRSDSATPRLHWARLEGPAPRGVASFVRVGDHLYLADRLSSRIIELAPAPLGAWRVDSVVADAALVHTPIAMAQGPNGTLIVYDIDRRIHALDPLRAGSARTIAAHVPCDVSEPQLAVSRSGAYLIAGRCPVGRGDTISAVLLLSRDSGRTFDALGTLPIYTRDGAWGSVLSARHYARVYGDSVAFGTGSDGCVVRLDLAFVRRIARDCSLGGTRYDAPEPRAFAAVRSLRVSMAMSHARATSWPHPLPVFLDRVDTPAGLAVVRLVTGDSVQVELAGARESRPLLVAPLDGFRGCAEGDCLWLRDVQGTTWIWLQRMSDLIPGSGARERP